MKIVMVEVGQGGQVQEEQQGQVDDGENGDGEDDDGEDDDEDDDDSHGVVIGGLMEG